MARYVGELVAVFIRFRSTLKFIKSVLGSLRLAVKRELQTNSYYGLELSFRIYLP